MPTLTAGTSSRRRTGFTLPDLVVTLAILCIVLGLALPSFSNISMNRAKMEAQKAASILRYINDEALSRKEPVPLSFDLSGTTISWKVADRAESKLLRSMKSVHTPQLGTVVTGDLSFPVTSIGALEEMDVTFSDGDETWVVTYSLSNQVRVKAGSVHSP